MPKDDRTLAQKAEAALAAWNAPSLPSPPATNPEQAPPSLWRRVRPAFQTAEGVYVLAAIFSGVAMTDAWIATGVFGSAALVSTFGVLTSAWNFKNKALGVLASVIFGCVLSGAIWWRESMQPVPATKADINAAIYQPPRITIGPTRIAILYKGDDIRVTANFVNTGQAHVTTLMKGASMWAGYGALNESQASLIFDNIGNAKDKESIDLEQDSPQVMTVPDNINVKSGLTVDTMKKVAKNGGSLYAFVEIRFIDVRDGSRWRSETCVHWDFAGIPPPMWEGMLAHNCPWHIGTFRLATSR